jgi:hypothetical protein
MMCGSHRWTALTTASCVLGVFGVPAFAQSDSAARGMIALERSSAAAVRKYVAMELVAADVVALPPNFVVPASYRPVIESMLRQSATFRRQCLRIANAPLLTVTLRLGTSQRYRSARAQTHIVTRAGGRRDATVDIVPLNDDVELIAHEIEHVVEQLDNVDLPSKAAVAGSGVRVCAGHESVFETIRAVRVGLRVAQEVRARR